MLWADTRARVLGPTPPKPHSLLVTSLHPSPPEVVYEQSLGPPRMTFSLFLSSRWANIARSKQQTAHSDLGAGAGVRDLLLGPPLALLQPSPRPLESERGDGAEVVLAWLGRVTRPGSNSPLAGREAVAKRSYPPTSVALVSSSAKWEGQRCSLCGPAVS